MGNGIGAVAEWQGAMYAGRQAFTHAWDAGSGSEGAAAAVAAFRAAFEETAAGWEALSFPDAHVPATAERALSYFGSNADAERVGAAPWLREDNLDEGLAWLTRSLAGSVDLEMLNDFAVMLHAAGRREDTVAVLQTILMVDPERADARENLEALIGGSA